MLPNQPDRQILLNDAHDNKRQLSPVQVPPQYWVIGGTVLAIGLLALLVWNLSRSEQPKEIAERAPQQTLDAPADPVSDQVVPGAANSVVAFPRTGTPAVPVDGGDDVESVRSPQPPSQQADEAPRESSESEAAIRRPQTQEESSEVGNKVPKDGAAISSVNRHETPENKTPHDENPITGKIPDADSYPQLEGIGRERDPSYATLSETVGAAKLSEYAGLVREILEIGWPRLSAVEAAEEKYRAAAALCPVDPRAGYAYGLVLLKHNQYDAALKQFEAVGEAAQRPYLPAYRAATWIQMLRKSYDAAALDLVGFTRSWRSYEPGRLPDWVQNDLVVWTGHMLGFLEGPVDSRAVDVLADKCARDIQLSLTPEHWELFKAAKAEVLDSYATRASDQEKARIEAKQQQQKESEEARARIDVEVAQNKEDKKQVERSTDELERDLREALARLDAEITSLAREVDRLETSYRSLSARVHAMDQEVNTLAAQRTQLLIDASASSGNQGGTTKPAPPRANSSVLALTATIESLNRERNRLQIELDRLGVRYQAVQRQGLVAINRRKVLINEYQSKTGRLYKEQESLATREKFLDRKKQELSKPATGSTTQVKILAQAAKALRTYVDLNLELEKERLLDSFEGTSRQAVGP